MMKTNIASIGLLSYVFRRFRPNTLLGGRGRRGGRNIFVWRYRPCALASTASGEDVLPMVQELTREFAQPKPPHFAMGCGRATRA